MDSRLDSIFKTTFRPAAETDTWQGIRREDPQDQNKKKNHDNNKNTPDEPQDYTTLSVQALQGFLRTLLNDASAATNPDPVTEKPTPNPTFGSNAYAATAYQNTANAGQPPVAQPETQGDAALKLNADELRTVHLLLKDIDHLIERSIMVITLKPAQSFLDSLVNGVREALNDPTA